MKLGFIGLGRMGANMVLHALEEGVEVVAYNRSKEKTDELVVEIQDSKNEIRNTKNFTPVYSVSDLVKNLPSPKTVWIMVAAGKAVDAVIDELQTAGITKDDIIIDGGNSLYKDTETRFEMLKGKGIHYLGVGTSGGLEGARHGACLMVGGEKEIYQNLKPLFVALAGKEGTEGYFGTGGAGHFVKMVHNGMEYGMLQSIGEGFELLYQSPYKLDLQEVSRVYNRGSVVRGWLVELLDEYMKKDPKITQADGLVGGGETGR
jgi:6-phosphogluconate dehydrogenase